MQPGLKKIGIFDSGVGGLTVYREVIKRLPNFDYVYLGDTARVPYGIRSPETIRKYALENCLFLMAEGAEAIVVACNTATAAALDFLQSVLKVPVFGVIQPGASAALKKTKNKKVAVIATEATIRSGAYQQALQKNCPAIFITERATPLLVPLVEENIRDPKILKSVFDFYFSDFEKTEIDTLILGCTHYPLLHDDLQEYFSGKISLVDSACATADFLKMSLSNSNGSTTRCENFFVTDAPERASRIATTFLGREILIKKVSLG